MKAYFLSFCLIALVAIPCLGQDPLVISDVAEMSLSFSNENSSGGYYYSWPVNPPKKAFDGSGFMQLNITNQVGLFAEAIHAVPNNIACIMVGTSFTTNINSKTGLRLRAAVGADISSPRLRTHDDYGNVLEQNSSAFQNIPGPVPFSVDAQLVGIGKDGETLYRSYFKYMWIGSIEWYRVTALVNVIKTDFIGSVGIGIKADKFDFVGPLIEFGSDNYKKISFRVWVAGGKTLLGVDPYKDDIRIALGFRCTAPTWFGEK